MRKRNIKDIESISLRNEKRGDDDLYIDDVSITYSQSAPNDEDVETLTISTQNNGIARYLNIKTDENGFSFTDEEELDSILDDFKKRAMI